MRFAAVKLVTNHLCRNTPPQQARSERSENQIESSARSAKRNRHEELALNAGADTVAVPVPILEEEVPRAACGAFEEFAFSRPIELNDRNEATKELDP